MKFSSKVQRCGLSPMRKFHPYAVAAKAAGKRVYHLNIGQPDIETPPVYFQAIRDFSQKVLEYTESPGIPALIRQVRSYYARLGVELSEEDVLVTTEAPCSVSEESITVGGGYELRVGVMAYLRGEGYMGSGPIVAIEQGVQG